jgi:hypothetical protein
VCANARILRQDSECAEWQPVSAARDDHATSSKQNIAHSVLIALYIPWLDQGAAPLCLRDPGRLEEGYQHLSMHKGAAMLLSEESRQHPQPQSFLTTSKDRRQPKAEHLQRRPTLSCAYDWIQILDSTGVKGKQWAIRLISTNQVRTPNHIRVGSQRSPD